MDKDNLDKITSFHFDIQYFMVSSVVLFNLYIDSVASGNGFQMKLKYKIWIRIDLTHICIHVALTLLNTNDNKVHVLQTWRSLAIV